MGFGYIAAGMLFLFNPNISVFDVLPDFIGYLLIYHGLFRMSFSAQKLAAVRENYLWKLALITLLRVASLALLPYTSQTFPLLIVFVCGVLEAIYFIPMTLELFDGFYTLGTRYDTASVFFPRVKTVKGKDGKRESVRSEGAEKLKAYTIVFFLIKTVAAVLPELTALQLTDNYDSNSRLHINLAQYKPLFYGFFGILTLIFGLVWLIRMLRYLGGMRRDAALRAYIDEYYRNNVAADPAFVAALRMKKVRLLFILAAGFSFTLILDGVNVLPGIISAAFLIGAFTVMLPYDKLAWGGIAASILCAVVSVSSLIVQIPYFGEYDAMAARYIARAAEMYGPVRLLAEAEYVLAMVMFGLAFLVFCRVMKKHAAYIGLTGAPQYSADARRAELLKSVNAAVLAAGIAGAAYFVMCAVYYTAAMYNPSVIVLRIMLSVVWIALAARAMSLSHDQIYERLEQNY